MSQAINAYRFLHGKEAFAAFRKAGKPGQFIRQNGTRVPDEYLESYERFHGENARFLVDLGILELEISTGGVWKLRWDQHHEEEPKVEAKKVEVHARYGVKVFGQRWLKWYYDEDLPGGEDDKWAVDDVAGPWLPFASREAAEKALSEFRTYHRNQGKNLEAKVYRFEFQEV